MNVPLTKSSLAICQSLTQTNAFAKDLILVPRRFVVLFYDSAIHHYHARLCSNSTTCH